jgi:hypothetical protein
MQEFDQEIAPPLGVSQQGADLGLRRWLDLPALGHGASAAPARARVARLLRGGMSFRHRELRLFILFNDLRGSSPWQ